jgi:hypothetical protein
MHHGSLFLTHFLTLSWFFTEETIKNNILRRPSKNHLRLKSIKLRVCLVVTVKFLEAQ